MTSNIGSSRILEVAKSNQGRSSSDELYAKMLNVVKEELEAGVKPEFLNRLDEIVVFAPLEDDALTKIASKLLDETLERAKAERGMKLTVTPALVNRVRDDGSEHAAQFGARPMRRAAQRFLEDSMSDALIQGFLSDGDEAEIDLGKVESDKCTVIITRKRDGKKLEVQVEDGSGGIGSTSTSSAFINGDDLQTETATS
jgi:ATP-dependent Clp protease ATP-binding subunit ClpC